MLKIKNGVVYTVPCLLLWERAVRKTFFHIRFPSNAISERRFSASKRLTLPTPIPEKGKKLTWIFIFTRLYGASKGFMKVFKAFIKLFEASQRSVKKKFNLIILIQLSEMSGAGRVKIKIVSITNNNWVTHLILFYLYKKYKKWYS